CGGHPVAHLTTVVAWDTATTPARCAGAVGKFPDFWDTGLRCQTVPSRWRNRFAGDAKDKEQGMDRSAVKYSIRRLGALVAAALVSALLLGAPSWATPAQGAERSQVNQDLAAVRRATARYHDVTVAERDGYVSTHECVSSPAGTMGIHYLNPALLDDTVDLEQPELLLYIPSGSRLRLVAVEYMVVDADQDLATDDDRPSLFDRPFHGPMPGHGPGQPVHYDLHAWVWQANPAGVFEDWNPKLACP
ncbi:MAG: hypothetical protein M3N52_04555, partial [Actinomycetota bacterium]|nr:hypothetical protein [Actinomycetota bacterium]